MSAQAFPLYEAHCAILRDADAQFRLLCAQRGLRSDVYVSFELEDYGAGKLDHGQPVVTLDATLTLSHLHCLIAVLEALPARMQQADAAHATASGGGA